MITHPVTTPHWQLGAAFTEAVMESRLIHRIARHLGVDYYAALPIIHTISDQIASSQPGAMYQDVLHAIDSVLSDPTSERTELARLVREQLSPTPPQSKS